MGLTNLKGNFFAPGFLLLLPPKLVTGALAPVWDHDVILSMAVLGVQKVKTVAPW